MFTRIRLSAFHTKRLLPSGRLIYYVCTEVVWTKLLANFKNIIFRKLQNCTGTHDRESKKNFRSSFRSSGLFLRITRHKVTCIKGQRNYRGLKAFLACVTVKLTSYPQLV